MKYRTNKRIEGILKNHFTNFARVCRNEFKVIVNKTAIDNYSQLIDLIKIKNTAAIEANYSKKGNEILVIGASSYAVQNKINKNYTIETLITSGGMAIIVPNHDVLLLLRIFPAMRNCFPMFYFATMSAIIIASIVWILEHKTNDEFPKSFGKGMIASTWFCYVTMTTVGYGDKVPKRWATQILCMCWMGFGLIIVAMVTTTVMEEVGKTVDMRGKSVAVLRNSAEKVYAKRHYAAIPKPYASYEEVLEAVENKDVAAALVDKNVAGFFFSNNVSKKYELKIQQELKLGIPIKVFILNNNQKKETNRSCICNNKLEHSSDRCKNKQFINKEDEFSIITNKHIIPIKVTPYYVRDIKDMLNNADYGVLRYLTITASFLVMLGIITEIREAFNRKNKKKSESTDTNDAKDTYKHAVRQKLEVQFNEILKNLDNI